MFLQSTGIEGAVLLSAYVQDQKQNVDYAINTHELLNSWSLSCFPFAPPTLALWSQFLSHIYDISTVMFEA